MRNASRSSIVDHAIVVVMLVALAVGAYAGVKLVSGGGDGADEVVEAVEASDEPPPYDPNATPGPPRGPVPTHDPSIPGGFSVPTRGPTPTPLASVEVSGVVIPMPEGAHYLYGGGPETIVGHWIRLGDSLVVFDDYGLILASIETSDEQLFGPTLDAIWTLTQKVGAPSPPSVVVDGVDIPLPKGSYYSKDEAQMMGGTEILVTYHVRFEHSLLRFTDWPLGFGTNVSVANAVRPGDAARFQGTLDAIALLAEAN